LFFWRSLGEREGQGSFMPTQISFMPTSRRCFGNPSSIVPYEAVCTKHRVLCTQQTRPSRGTPIPFRSASGPCGVAGSPLRICATAASDERRRDGPRFGSRPELPLSFSLSLSLSLPGVIRELRSRGERPISPRPGSRRARRVAGSKHTCLVLSASALFARRRSASREIGVARSTVCDPPPDIRSAEAARESSWESSWRDRED